MPTYDIADLDDLSIAFEARTGQTLIDSAITLPANITVLNGFTLTIGGLEATDTVSVQTGGSFFMSGSILVTNGIVEGFFGIIGTVTSGPGSFSLVFASGVPRAAAEAAIEALQFTTSDERAFSTRSLTYTITDSVDTISGSSTLTIGSAPPSPATLADLAEKAHFTIDALSLQGPQFLDSDVTVTLDQGLDTLGAVITVTGMAEGDTVLLRMQHAGSPFAISQSQPDVFDLHHEGDMIGHYYAGYNNGTETPFVVVFTTQVSAAIIEAVIENLQFTSTVEGGSTRDLTIAFSDNSLQTVYFQDDITVKTVPGLASLRDVAGFVPGAVAPHNKLDSKMSLGDGVSFAGGQMVISGLLSDDNIGLDDISGQGTVTLVDGPNDTFQLFFFSDFIGSGSYVTTPTGRDFVLDIDPGLGSTLLDRVIKSLTFLTTASAEDHPSRTLTIAFYDTTGDIGMRDDLTVNLGSLDISGYDAPISLQVGADPVALGTNLTFGGPVGYDYAGSEIRLISNTTDDHFTVLTSDLIRLDSEGRIFFGYHGGYEIGTLAAGDSGDLRRATITLNSNADPYAIDALLEALAVSRNGLLTEDTANFSIRFVSANGVDESTAIQGADVTARELGELRQTLYYNTDGGPQRIDHNVSLVDGHYVGWTLTISGLDTETDSIGLDADYRGGDYYFIQNGTLWRHVGFVSGDFAIGSVTTANNQVVIAVGEQSTWLRNDMEHLLESLNFNSIGSNSPTLTLTLENARGTYFQDTIAVVNGPSVRGLEGLAQNVIINPLHDEQNGGPALIDSDVTVPGHLGSLPTTVTVSGLEKGDVVGVRAVDSPEAGQLGVNGGLLYRQTASDIELLGYANGGNGSDFSVGFFVGVTAEQIEAVVEALTFTSTSRVISRELAITVGDSNGPAARGLIDVVLDLTPLIADMSRTVKFDAATIATTPMVIDSDVTLPTDISYGRMTINIARPAEVQIGIGGEFRLQAESPFDTFLYRGDTGIAYWGVNSQSNYISFTQSATRADVESVMEALTFTSSVTDQPLRLTISIGRTDGDVQQVFARSEVVLEALPGDQVVSGSELADTLTGDVGNDLISGLEGDDLLSGLIGRDQLFGGEGYDTLYGGVGRDSLYGEDGDDLLYGGKGNDLLSGGAGDDTLNGLGDDDRLFGDDGNDQLAGQAGADLLYGGAGSDLLYGGEDNDRLFGGEGDDMAYGGAGADLMRGGIGEDSLFGGDGADTAQGGVGNDLLRGGAGDDALFGGNGVDSLVGGDGADTLSGDRGADWLNGGAGEDVFLFALGDLGTGVDHIADFTHGEDLIHLGADITAWLELGGGNAADALVWNATNGELSLDPTATGSTGSSLVIARFANFSGLTLTADDVLFL